MWPYEHIIEVKYARHVDKTLIILQQNMSMSYQYICEVYKFFFNGKRGF